ncbi:MAG: DUF4493 domain-containing protein [Bacteroidaceae bacterium]|nr:DUF4493 domain-containing protein [Bacteroidaceae bacterium]
MKKIYLAALTLAMTACVSTEDLNPVDNYGYIDVNVSNDPVMVTRAEQTVGNISSWTITTKKGENTPETWSSEKAYEAGDYTVAAQNYVDETAWKKDNENYGAAFYQGATNVTVKAGETAPATINCRTAKNAKLTVTISDMPTAFTNVTLTAKRDASTNLEFPGINNKTEAFFGAQEVVSYSLSYEYNEEEKSILNQTITMAGAATNNVITISANSNGLISVSIKYDDAFGEGNNSTIQFDAATGEQV